VKAGRYREAQALLRPVLTENPGQRAAGRLQRAIDEKLAPPALASIALRPASEQPISLELRDVTVRNVFELLQRASGIAFLFDRDVRTDQRTSIALRNATIEEAIRQALLTNQLEQKVLNETTVFVFPSTPQKLREHQELVVKAFYVANADVRQTANMIRTLVKTRDIFIDEKIGLLAIKDTPAAVRLAERLVAAQDLAEPELMLEVEVLEVSRTRLLELGLRFPDSVAWSVVGAAGTPGSVTLPEWLNRSSELVQLSFTDPLFLLSLRQQDTATTVLAQPAHPRQEQGQGAHPHRRPRAGDHHHRRGDRRLRLGVGLLPGRRAQAGGRAAGLPRRRRGHQGRAGSEQTSPRKCAARAPIRSPTRSARATRPPTCGCTTTRRRCSPA